MEPRPQRFGALAATLFSLVGYAACLFLNVVKLRTEHNCHSFVEDVCGDRCSSTLRSTASELLGLPITVHGAALYLVASVLAYRASRGATWAHIPLLALAGWIFAISAGYFAYAALFLRTICEFCGLLYLTSIGLLLGAWLLSRPLRSLPSPLGLHSPRAPALRARVMAALTVLGLTTSLTLHVNLFRRFVVDTERETCSQSEPLELPNTSLRVPAAGEPRVVVAVFIDLACPHCRTSVEFWRRYQADRRDLIELRFYHFPRDCKGPSEDHACDAARVVECLAPQLPGRELELFTALLALQDGPSPFFTGERLNAVAQGFGLTGAEACRRSNALVQAHLEFAHNEGLRARPSALVIRMDEGAPTSAFTVLGSTKNEAFLDQKIDELLHGLPP